jgi:hypothetical protein
MRYIAQVDAARLGDFLRLDDRHPNAGSYAVARPGGKDVFIMDGGMFAGLFVPAANGEPRKAARESKPKPAETPDAKEDLGKRGAKSLLVMAALEDGQKTPARLVQWLQENGWPWCTNTQLNSQVQRLRRQGIVANKNHEWRLVR